MTETEAFTLAMKHGAVVSKGDALHTELTMTPTMLANIVAEVRAPGAPQEAAVAVPPEQVEKLAHRMAWRYRKSSDPHHSDTFTFNRDTLLQFAAALAGGDGSSLTPGGRKP